MLFVLLGVCGMAIDLGLMYNRRVELQNLADAAALAAANQLDGTANGVDRAVAAAADVAQTYRYQFRLPVSWNPAAIAFAMGPGRSDEWVPAGTAHDRPGGRVYARVDTRDLATAHNLVRALFLRVIGQDQDAQLQGLAIAGRTGIRVAPLAICAMSPVVAAARDAGSNKELVEFGFRRGVSYDLMQLNPNGTAPENFVVNPFAPPGTVGTAGPTSPAIVGPYICSGTMSMPRVMAPATPEPGALGAPITVARPFPLAALVNHLNSRFDQYVNNACSRAGAPPDFNIKSFTYAGISWMTTLPSAQSAAMLPQATGKLMTVADVYPTPANTTAAKFGPLWIHARSVPFGNYVQGVPEPVGGYGTFNASTWPDLYTPGQPTPKKYPDQVPYQATAAPNFSAPSTRGVPNRRVLNIPLLDCPVPAGTTVTANVRGIGRFFMTVPATSSTLYAEFGGLVTDGSLGSSTGLFP